MVNAKLEGQSKNKIYKLSLLTLYVQTKVESLLPMNAFLMAISRSPEEDQITGTRSLAEEDKITTRSLAEEDQINRDALACRRATNKRDVTQAG